LQAIPDTSQLHQDAVANSHSQCETDLFSRWLQNKNIQAPKQFKMWLNSKKSCTKMHEDRNVKHRRQGRMMDLDSVIIKKDPKENHLLQAPCRTP